MNAFIEFSCWSTVNTVWQDQQRGNYYALTQSVQSKKKLELLVNIAG